MHVIEEIYSDEKKQIHRKIGAVAAHSHQKKWHQGIADIDMDVALYPGTNDQEPNQEYQAEQAQFGGGAEKQGGCIVHVERDDIGIVVAQHRKVLPILKLIPADADADKRVADEGFDRNISVGQNREGAGVDMLQVCFCDA